MGLGLRIAFMGTPQFAVASLTALVDAGHDAAAVYTQPPRRAGRGRAPRPSPVAETAQRLGLAVRTPTSLKSDDEAAAFRALNLDAALVVAYGLMLPPPILRAPRLGCLNAHASLLPRWRGAAPIQRAILAGDATSGVTIVHMDDGLDTGPMLLRREVPIGAGDAAADLHDRLAELSAEMLVEALRGVAAGTLAATPQPAAGATYAAKVGKADGRLDWRQTAADLDRRVRAMTPWPGAWFTLVGEPVKVLAATPLRHARPSAPPGTILDRSFLVACGAGALRLERVRRAGKAETDGAAFLRGVRLAPGAVLDPCATG